MSVRDWIAARMNLVPKEKIFPPVTEGWTLTSPLAPLLGYTGSAEHKVTQPMKQIAAVYACVAAKARNIGGVEFKLYPKAAARGIRHFGSVVQKMAHLKQIEQEEITSGPIYELFQDVNAIDTRFQLWEQIITYLELTGEWFVRRDEQSTQGGVPASLWPENPRTMEPAKNGTTWIGWWWTPEGESERKFLSTKDVIFDRYVNPYHKIRGLAPLDAARLTMESDLNARVYNRNFFRNDGTPNIAFITKDGSQLTDAQFKRLQHELLESRRGVDKAHENIILENMDVKQVGLSQKDIEFISQRKFTTEEICMIYHTPKSIVSVYEDTNYATAQIAEQQWWTDELIPHMTRIEDKFNKELLGPLGYVGYFDVMHVDALAFAITNRVDAATKLWSIGVPLNAINDRLEFGFDHFDWGDAPSPVSQGASVAQAPPPGRMYRSIGTKDVTDSRAMIEAAREKQWTDVMMRVLPIMGRMTRRVRTYFHEAEQRIIATFVKGFKTGVPKIVKAAPTADDINNAFSDDQLLKIEYEFLTEDATTGYKMFVDVGFNDLPDAVAAEVAKRATMVSEINKHARTDLLEEIRDTLRQATEQGASEQTTARMLVDAMKGKMAEITRRAKTIARTEVHTAFSVARHMGADNTKPTGKRWLSSRDSKVRDEHHRADDGQVVPWDQPFRNGLMYPMEPGAAASEVINCRCVEIPIYGKE